MAKVLNGRLLETAVTSFILSSFALLGVCSRKADSLMPLANHPTEALVAFLVAFAAIFALVTVFALWCGKRAFGYRCPRRLRWVGEHLTLTTMIFITICWLPVLAGYFPGVVGYDPNYEIRQFMGYTTFTTHHPPAHAFLLGAFYSLGCSAMFVLVLLQVLLFSFAVGRVAALLKAFDLRFGLIVSFVVLCAVFCFFPAREVSVYKESLYLSVFVLFACKYVEIVCFGRRGRKMWAELLFFAVCLTLLRNDGIFVAGVSCLCLVFLKGRSSKTLALAVSGALLALAVAVNAVLWPSLGIVSGSKGEMFSVPLQQTARYLVFHGDEVTEEEADAIAGVVDVSRVAEAYDSDFADPVKSLWLDPGKEEVKDYVTAWGSMLCKHPGVYFEALVLKSYGFFLPWTSNLNGHPEDTFQLVMREQYEPYVALGFSFSESTANLRAGFEGYCNAWVSNPLLCLLSNPGIYSWLLLLLLVFAVGNAGRRGSRNVIAFMPAIMVLVFCVLGPVNGYMRYFLPVVVVLPLLLCAVFSPMTMEGEDTEGKGRQ